MSEKQYCSDSYTSIHYRYSAFFMHVLISAFSAAIYNGEFENSLDWN